MTASGATAAQQFSTHRTSLCEVTPPKLPLSHGSVMIASVKNHLVTVNLVMRSVLQTRTQPTQQYCCPLYRLELILYVLAASAMWAIMPLSASSCEQGASPSLCCRKIASLSIAQMTCLTVDNVTIYILRNANSAVSFSLIMNNSPHFWNCIIGLYSATDSFPSRVQCLRF